MAGRLVAEQELGPLRERPGDRDALRLAAGELAGRESRFAARPTSASSSSGVAARRASAPGRERDVLERREVRQQVRALEDVGDARAHAARAAASSARAARPSTRRSRRWARRGRRATCSSVVLPGPGAAPAARAARPGRSRSRRRRARRRGARPAPYTTADACAAGRERDSLTTTPPVADLDHAVGGARRLGGEWVTTTTVLPCSSRSARARRARSARSRRRARRSARRRARAAPRARPRPRSRPAAARRRRAGRAVVRRARRGRTRRAPRPPRPGARRAGEAQRDRARSLAPTGAAKVVALEHDRDLAGAVGGELRLVEPRERAAERADLAGGRRVERRREREQRALPAARRAEHRDQLAAARCAGRARAARPSRPAPSGRS